MDGYAADMLNQLTQVINSLTDFLTTTVWPKLKSIKTREMLLAIGLISSITTAIWVVRTNKKFKQSDVMLEFRKRYDKIQDNHKGKDSYCKKMWSLFHDEFISYSNGRISREIFTLWTLNFLIRMKEPNITNTQNDLLAACPFPLENDTKAHSAPCRIIVLPTFITMVERLHADIAIEHQNSAARTNLHNNSLLPAVENIVKPYRKHVLKQVWEA